VVASRPTISTTGCFTGWGVVPGTRVPVDLVPPPWKKNLTLRSARLETQVSQKFPYLVFQILHSRYKQAKKSRKNICVSFHTPVRPASSQHEINTQAKPRCNCRSLPLSETLFRLGRIVALVFRLTSWHLGPCCRSRSWKSLAALRTVH
jgi:hypothetical protein